MPENRGEWGRPPKCGLQPERTALAWLRTALSIFVVAMLSLRSSLTEGTLLSLAAASVAIFLGIAMIFRAIVRPSYDAEGEEVTTPASRLLMRTSTGTVLLIAVLESIRAIFRMTGVGVS